MSPIPFSPLYRWLAETLRDEIAQGIYKPGDALPTEQKLMLLYNLSSTTVRRAVHDLAREGLIYRKSGKGTFVNRTKVEERLLRLTSFAEEMQERGIAPYFRLLRAETLVPPPEVARALQLTARTEAFLIERVQMADCDVLALAVGYWRPEVGQSLVRQDLNVVSLYQAVEQTLHIPLIEAEESICAARADADQARKLQTRLHAPLLVRRRVTYTTGQRPLEYTTSLYRADRYEYKVRLLRHTP